MYEQLLGYLLDALDPAERTQVEERLRTDPEWRAELARLRKLLGVLDHDPEHVDPPADLAQRTCQGIWFRQERQARQECGPTRGWNFRDTLITSGICVAASLLLLPAIQHARLNAQLISCSNNLRQLGAALNSYSEYHQGYFPAIPLRGNTAGAGAYAPLLMQAGFLQEPRAVVCPGSPWARQNKFHIPTVAELERASDCQILQLRRQMGGSYGYTLGHVQNGCYRPTRNRSRTNFAVASDAPSRHLLHMQSANHDGLGQNVLFEAGNVSFWRTPKPNDAMDGIFTNHSGHMSAGDTQDDAVLGDSEALPIHTPDHSAY